MYNKEAVLAYKNLKMPKESTVESNQKSSMGLLSRMTQRKPEKKQESSPVDNVSKYVFNIRKARQELKSNDRT